MLHSLQSYIQKNWQLLQRSPFDVAPDPKIDARTAYLYIPPHEDRERIAQAIALRQQHTGDTTPIALHCLPDDANMIAEHGVLYLPHDYVVPGGRFNEMYGWDSYWIVLGLLRDSAFALAKGMVENCFYQIAHYGARVLNANRTYYLTRSQPPLLGLMVQAVAAQMPQEERHVFLERARDALVLNYEQFWHAQRYDPDTGLFHYGHPSQGEFGLCQEVVFGERIRVLGDLTVSHYDKVIQALRALPPEDPVRKRCYDEANGSLTPFAIAGDRALRESGFDPSMIFGLYGLEATDYRPVCLNTLLYKQCQILAGIHLALDEPKAAQRWQQNAEQLRSNIQTMLWNERLGLFTNYNHRAEDRSDFAYLTAAYPLWAEIATADQAARFVANLPLFETDYGVMNTPHQTGCQWDGPLMWAPLVYFTVEGLKRYGYDAEARRIAQKFIDSVTRVFISHGNIYEKYNAQDGSNSTGVLTVGYPENVAGFGWTNATVALLADWLEAEPA